MSQAREEAATRQSEELHNDSQPTEPTDASAHSNSSPHSPPLPLTVDECEQEMRQGQIRLQRLAQQIKQQSQFTQAKLAQLQSLQAEVDFEKTLVQELLEQEKQAAKAQRQQQSATDQNQNQTASNKTRNSSSETKVTPSKAKSAQSTADHPANSAATDRNEAAVDLKQKSQQKSGNTDSRPEFTPDQLSRLADRRRQCDILSSQIDDCMKQLDS